MKRERHYQNGIWLLLVFFLLSCKIAFADPDLTPPVMTSAPTVTDVTDTTAFIEWQTDEAATSIVQYGVHSAAWDGYAQTVTDTDLVNHHSVLLSGLDADERYYFRVGSVDGQSNGPTISSEICFATDPYPDTTPPVFVSPPTVVATTHDSATIVWQTDEPANSQVQYGMTGGNPWNGYPQVENDAAITKRHVVTITGLFAYTAYYFRVGSADAAGNGPRISAEVAFTTTPDPDVTPPQIIATPTVTAVSNSTAVVEWTTNELSSSQVQFGETSAAWDAYAGTQSQAGMTVNHLLMLTNLSGATRYFFRVGSTDAAGNGPTTSVEVHFTTDPAPDTTPPRIVSPPTVAAVSNTSAVIVWTTDEPGNSLVHYGTSSAVWEGYPESENDGSTTSNHMVTLTGLSGDTIYYFRVGTMDAAGNGPIKSAEISFTTTPDPDITPPVLVSPPTVTGITHNSATIEWLTDEPANSQVQFGTASATWEAYPQAENNDGMTMQHCITLTDLSPATAYYFRAGSTDAAGNGPDPHDPDSSNPFSEFSFVTASTVDATAPRIIAGPSIAAIDASSVVIEWETDEPANGLMHFGETPSAWGGYPHSKNEAVMRTHHSVTLTGLVGSTTYYYRVGSIDAAGNGPDSAPNGSNPSGEAGFTTAAAIDATAPAVSNVMVQKLTNSTALITWETDEAANSQVRYAMSGNENWHTYTFQRNDPQMRLKHSLTLTHLQPDTQYFFRVGSTDARGNGPAPSAEDAFVTGAGPDVTAPQIIYFSIGKVTDTTAVVSWTTDEPGNSQVHFDTESPANWQNYARSENDAGMTTDHSVTLTGLSPDTLYYLRVSSTDAGGNDFDTSAIDRNPSIELNLKTGEPDPPSIIEYPDAQYPDRCPQVDAENNYIEITYDALNMKNARKEAYYTLTPALTFVDPGHSIELVSSPGPTSTYRLAFESVDAYKVYTLTLGSEITNADGLSVAPDTVLLNDDDGDDLPNALEINMGTDPHDADSDDDGIADGLEDFDLDGEVDAGETDPRDADTDNDGVQDGTELGYTLLDIVLDTDIAVFIPDADAGATTTDPLDPDSDGDGFSDGAEDRNLNGRIDAGEGDPNDEFSQPVRALPWLPVLLE